MLSTSPVIGAPRKRTPLIIAAGLFALLSGALAMVLALRGFQGKGTPGELVCAWPNLITGVASVTGGYGYLRQRRWALPVYAVAFIGHLVAHGILIAYHGGRVGGLWVMPLLALVVLLGMNNCRRKGRLV